MRGHILPLALLAAGCAAPTPPTPAADHATAVSACAAAVAAHVGKDPAAVVAAWTGDLPDGAGLVTVTDAAGGGAERVHACEVDAGGRVRAIRHEQP